MDVIEFKTSGNIKIKDINIKYFEVDHKPVKYAYGFCFTSKNKNWKGYFIEQCTN